MFNITTTVMPIIGDLLVGERVDGPLQVEGPSIIFCQQTSCIILTQSVQSFLEKA